MSAVLLFWELIIVLSLDLLDWVERKWDVVGPVLLLVLLFGALAVVGTVEYASL